MLMEAERELLALIIGHQVRDSRKRQGMSQFDLAQGIGSQSMVSLIESGRQLALPDVLHLLATRLGDSTLIHYATMLTNGIVRFEEIPEVNHSILLDALRTQRGRWQDVHGQVAMQLCEYHYTIRLFDIVREICQLVERHSDSSARRAQAYFFYGSSYLFDEDYKQAEHWLRKAESMSNVLDEELQGRLTYNLAYLYTCLDTQGMAMWYAKCASELFARRHDFPRHAKSLGLLGTTQLRLGLIEDARQTLELSQEIATRWKIDAIDVARIASTLATTYVELEQYDMAEVWNERSMEKAQECGDTFTLCDVYRTRFFLHRFRGENALAGEALQQATKLANLAGAPAYLAHALLLAIEHLPTIEDKISAAQQAYDVASNHRSCIEEALSAECLALLHEEAGRPETASHFRKIALSAYRENTKKNSMFKHVIKFLPKELES
jgi:transcriptional regulator with XRE-family HTH domain